MFSSHRQKLSPVEVCSNLSPATLTTKADTFRLLDLILRMLIYFMVMQTQAAFTSKIIVSIEAWFYGDQIFRGMPAKWRVPLGG